MPSADRRELASVRTLRPEGTDDASSGLGALPTVAESIADAAFVAGDPAVVAGHGALGNRVRWVHASDNPDVARFFEGGELLLSTGNGWPADDAGLAALVEGLAAARVAGMVLELGTRFAEPPAPMVEAADRVGLPLVVLRREVRFVSLTEAIHRRIIGAQIDALSAGAEVRERFTALALRGSPADFVVGELARTLGSPVVLENLAHDVVAAEFPGGGDAATLARWQATSRAVATHHDGWLVVPVEARGATWGRLVAPPGPAHPAGRLAVLEQGAIALALGRLAAGADEWAGLAGRRLLSGLIDGRFATADEAMARLEAAGLPIQGRALFGFVVGLASGAAQVAGADVEGAVASVGGVARAWERDGAGVVALASFPVSAPLDDASARRVAAELGPAAMVTVGRAAHGVDEALASLRDALDDAGAVGAVRGAAGARVRWANERPLAQLMNSLRDDHRLLEHGERMLAPLIEHDSREGGDLLDVLGALLAHPGNRTEAARSSHLSRSVFYQRLAVIAGLLDADLDDGETQTALHVALLARRGGR